MSSDSTQQLIVLVDSSGLLRRRFETSAPKLGRTKDGHHVEVAAIEGYLSTIAKRFYGQYREIEFDQLIHVLDSDGSDYRRGLYPEYKAGRPPKSPAIATQEAMLPQVLTGLGEHIAQRRGVEADDLIATLARQYADLGHHVAVYTGDKDLFQLVEDGRIVVIRDEKNEDKYNKMVFYYEAQVKEKMNVNADQIAAYLALMGDTVDNIKGVKGIGKKTAAQLLNEYGSLAGILTHADQIKGKLGENLREARDSGSLDLDHRLTLALDQLEGISPDQYVSPVIVETTVATQIHLTLGMIGHPLRLSDHRVVHEQSVPRSVHPDGATAPTQAPPRPQTPSAPSTRFGNRAGSPPPVDARPVATAPAPMGSRLEALVEDNPFDSAFGAEVAPTAASALTADQIAALDLPFGLEPMSDDEEARLMVMSAAELDEHIARLDDKRYAAEAAAQDTSGQAFDGDTTEAEDFPDNEPAPPADPVAPIRERATVASEPVTHYAEEVAEDDGFMDAFGEGFALESRPEFAKGAPLKTVDVPQAEAAVAADTPAETPADATPKRTRAKASETPAPTQPLPTDVFPPEGSEPVVVAAVVETTVTTTVTPAEPPRAPTRRFGR